MPIRTIDGAAAWAGLAGGDEQKWPDISARFASQPFVVEHQPGFELDMASRFFCLGSCFARNIEEHLIYRGADVLSKRVVSPAEEWPWRVNGFMNKFTTQSMLQELRWLETPPADPKDFLVETTRGWRDLQLAPELVASPLERALERRRYLAEDYFPRLRQADVVLMTLGLNEVWYDRTLGVHLNAPPSPWTVRREPGRYAVDVTDVGDNVAALEEIRARLKALNPEMKIILTVSPVPMGATFSGRDVAVANTLSKSTLRAAADAFQMAHADVDYFPSYEIVTLSAREHAYAADCLHVADQIVSHVMATFLSLYCKSAPQAPEGFSEMTYLDANPDVEDAVRAGILSSGYEHWIKHGRGEGRRLRTDEISGRAARAGVT